MRVGCGNIILAIVVKSVFSISYKVALVAAIGGLPP